ncbi:hypothetical protein HELRODRAFT_163776 [Helobdella robusta]|uniref:Uncharacterized protein n=1 Tax=Helobdella robusta TaxID=6412 RepID=T1EUG3_HELRO|nr:hypothetical protein HELRODRAFT_163776 [Helobdella robusta]ESN96677.1 hypothetical protein HELRODRAFT_163776 [Helobdella robusta]
MLYVRQVKMTDFRKFKFKVTNAIGSSVARVQLQQFEDTQRIQSANQNVHPANNINNIIGNETMMNHLHHHHQLKQQQQQQLANSKRRSHDKHANNNNPSAHRSLNDADRDTKKDGDDDDDVDAVDDDNNDDAMPDTYGSTQLNKRDKNEQSNDINAIINDNIKNNQKYQQPKSLKNLKFKKPSRKMFTLRSSGTHLKAIILIVAIFSLSTSSFFISTFHFNLNYLYPFRNNIKTASLKADK